jgi:hypothetical protein
MAGTNNPGIPPGMVNAAIDPNRFYSIILDARAVKASATMGDIAEKLLNGEKENAKIALNHLGELKNALGDENNGTVDIMIGFYQEKINVLRGKEERLRQIGRDSRGLIEEKRMRDEEIASIRQQIGDCKRDIASLSATLEKLSIKEQELALIDLQLGKELLVNSSEIVNGLYEIILPSLESDSPEADAGGATPAPAAAEAAPAIREPAPEPAQENPEVSPLGDDAGGEPVSRVFLAETPPFPRSVVKTTGGQVIGEYYYDDLVDKRNRHYIFNSLFFARLLDENLRRLREHFTQAACNELLQMIQDAFKRVTGTATIHFEISTNEILNENSLRQLWVEAKARLYDDMERFAARLLAKIEGLGRNYPTMLKEQMERCLKNS